MSSISEQPRQIKLLASGSSLQQSFSKEPDPIRRSYDLRGYAKAAQFLEDAYFDGIFEADAVLFEKSILKSTWRPHLQADAVALATVAAAATSRIGVIPTASTSFNLPYQLARQFATLDHMSHGRVGWNAVTSFGGEKQYGYKELPNQDDRYKKADEFVRIVQGLWDGWRPDAITVVDGRITNIDLRQIDDVVFHGDYHRVEGALGLPRSPQGRPVQFQAGGSAAGIEFAARHAEAIFSASPDIEHARWFYSQVAAESGRKRPGHSSPLIFPGVGILTDQTERFALEHEAEALAGLDLEEGRISLSHQFGGILLADLDLDETIPPERLPDATTLVRRQSRPALYRRLAEQGLTLRRLIQIHLTGHGHFRLVGSYDQVAEHLEQWFLGGAADGFVVQFRRGLIDANHFVEHIIPRLQDRGLFRTQYESFTLRGNLGLEVPTWQTRVA